MSWFGPGGGQAISKQMSKVCSMTQRVHAEGRIVAGRGEEGLSEEGWEACPKPSGDKPLGPELGKAWATE